MRPIEKIPGELMTNVEKAPLCKCGCGRPVQGKYDRTRKSRGVMKGDWHDFIKGHHAGYMTRVTERGEAPLCACGCGQQIEDTHKVGNRRDGIRAGEWKRYIHGHNKGRKGTGIREILDAEKLHELHWEDHLNCDGVAKHLGISEDYVKDLFKEYDVQRWDKNLYPREWFALPYEQLHDAMRLLVGEDRVQAIHGKRSVYNLGANVIHVDTFDKVGAIGEYSELYYD